jgi:hypothetical protein
MPDWADEREHRFGPGADALAHHHVAGGALTWGIVLDNP